MHFETTPSSSPSKSIPITIGAMASPSGSICSISSTDSSSSFSSSPSRSSTCAFPSWPTGNSLGFRSTPSSFISDADLFGDFDDEDCTPFLESAPAPPRQPPMAQAFPLLPPIYATEKKQQQQKQQRRRSSGRKTRRSSKPMTPIAESVEIAE
ncbi:hypothetical protein BU24DRAFT_108733 [Aaosphaeria arxii CBS 175.79]|uniref:Uncharacterized protein n=1 Tax=Aaosphaeria arxii CBS 175.79 TaxID=1450172 RepID=A0A6A5Y075_9PLEO|nr:uncharacterized protein BU24DRAFT_108733 [Aaosphaeria arxii CBS 175.79]KAF2018935.1 hypothetical protein BU24DRAFT_108733 [Aaosphaeria arxii CBS 175.79]